MLARIFIFLLILGITFSCNLAKQYARKTEKKYERLSSRFDFVDTDSARIHVRSLGTGPETIVLIHGFGPLPGLQWIEVAEKLHENYKLVVPDLVYFGNSTSNHRQYSPQFQARQIAKALDDLGISSYYVGGLSYGGLVAAITAHKNQSNVKGLILIDALSRFYSSNYSDSLANANGEDSMFSMLLPRNGKQLKKTMKMSYHKPPHIPTFLLNKPAIQLFADPNGHKNGLMLYLIQHEHQIQNLNLNYPGPVKIIWGEKDILIPVVNAMKIKNYYSSTSEVSVIPNAGHAVNMENPEAVTEAIDNFVKDEMRSN